MDIDAATRAINTVGLDYYLLKPWSRPEEKLDRVPDELTEDWLTDCRPPLEGVRYIGHRWSLRTYEIQDLRHCFWAASQKQRKYLSRLFANLGRLQWSGDRRVRQAGQESCAHVAICQ